MQKGKGRKAESIRKLNAPFSRRLVYTLLVRLLEVANESLRSLDDDLELSLSERRTLRDREGLGGADLRGEREDEREVK